MNMIGKFATSLVAVAAFGAIIFASTGAESMKPAQSATVVAAADASQSRVEPSPASGPLNSKETPQEQLKDLQYN
jgi:hypothetical protein